MEKDDVENILNKIQIPEPENIMQPREFKIPLLSYKKSSKAGLWLLLVPFTFAITLFLKTELAVKSVYIDMIRGFFSFIDNNDLLTYLIPLIFIGLPLTAMIINFLAICHFQENKKAKELIITVKYRPLNIAIFLISFGLIIFFFLPDKLSF